MAQSYSQLKAAGVENEAVLNLVKQLSGYITEMERVTSQLEGALNTCTGITDHFEDAKYHRDTIRTLMEELRGVSDRMETMVSAEAWPIPTYADLLYRV